MWYNLLKGFWEIIRAWLEPDEIMPTHEERLDKLPEPVHPEPIVNKDWLDKLIVGLVYAESRGDVNCIGDRDIPESKGGQAYGILQIRSGVRSEVNVLWGKDYKGKDLLGETGAELSRLMCRAYFLSIAPQYKSYKSSLKAGISLEETCAKIWNGGPGAYLQSKKKGYEKYAKGLEMYWETVREHMPK